MFSSFTKFLKEMKEWILLSSIAHIALGNAGEIDG
jgi:hypothetical protein